MLRIGLTGSIGMGKSTTAGLFAQAGVPVYDSDANVHALYEGEAVRPVEAAFPGVMRNGIIDRSLLSQHLAGNPQAFAKLEAIVHPLVRRRQEQFLDRCREAGASMALLDIPLLFETNAQSRVDVVVVVSADPQVQRQRVLAREGMTEDKFQMILARQIPDREKRERADFVIDTGKGVEAARHDVLSIIETLKHRIGKGENNA